MFNSRYRNPLSPALLVLLFGFIGSTAPLLARFDAAQAPATQAIPSPPQSAAQPPQVPAPSAVPQPPRVLVLIDAAHGGEDRGANLTPSLAEKDVTLAFARRLKFALDAQGIVSALVRDSDATLGADQRTAVVNASHAALVISVHATSSGSAIHLYTAMTASQPRTAFLPWASAQSAFLDQSRADATAISRQLDIRKIANIMLRAPLRPLSSFAHPAIAIELTPKEDKPDSLILLSFQQPIVSAVAAGIAELRPQLEATH